MDLPQITINVPLVKADYQTWEAWTESLPIGVKLVLMIAFIIIAVIAIARSIQ